MKDESRASKMEKADKRMYSPYKFSGMDYQFNPDVDKANIKNMRDFTNSYFS